MTTIAGMRLRHLGLLDSLFPTKETREAQALLLKLSDTEYQKSVEAERDLVIKREIVRALLMARDATIPLKEAEINKILEQARAQSGDFDVPSRRDDITEELQALGHSCSLKRPEEDPGEHRVSPSELPGVDYITTQDGTKLPKAP